MRRILKRKYSSAQTGEFEKLLHSFEKVSLYSGILIKLPAWDLH